MAPPLRHGICWGLLVLAGVAAWPKAVQSRREWWAIGAALVASVALLQSAIEPVNVLAVALFAAAFAWRNRVNNRAALATVALAATTLSVYRLAISTIPTVWLAADWLGRGLGHLAGGLAGNPLEVGATFAGIDLLVFMVAWIGIWVLATPRPRWPRTVYAGVAVVIAQLAYLSVLAWAVEIAAWLPTAPPEPTRLIYEPPAWHWGEALRTLLPWNLPLVGLVLQLAVVGLALRWSAWAPVEEPLPAKLTKNQPPASPSEKVLRWSPVALAALLPLIALPTGTSSDLSKKRFLALNEDVLSWDKPRHDRFGMAEAGMFGMLPTFVESLGGTLTLSNELSQEELGQADALVLIHPSKPWPEDRLERVWQYVRDGGNLLVVAETAMRDPLLKSSFNDVLAPTAMQVRFDASIPGSDGWEHGLEILAHPMTTGVDAARNGFGMGQAASIELSLPARPILAGRWGWSNPGNDARPLGGGQYESGEKLGDLVVAAEQSFGRGRIVVLSDTTPLTNLVLPWSYQFAGQTLGYLTNGGVSHQTWLRQLLGMAACVGLIALVARQREPARLALVALVFAACAWEMVEADRARAAVLPGAGTKPSNVALIDDSHLEPFSPNLVSNEGISDFEQDLMRNDYLPLVMRRFDARLLDRASVLVVIAPARKFTASEAAAIERFLDRDGSLICMAGADQADAVRPLVEPHGLGLPEPFCDPNHFRREPLPLGPMGGGYRPTAESHVAPVTFFAPWPVECGKDEAMLQSNSNVPVGAFSLRGPGRVLLIADGGFALNKNRAVLEGGLSAPYGENSHFWRYFSTVMRNEPAWVPPKTEPGEKPAPRKPRRPETEDDADGGDGKEAGR